ncbi:hypothetical protein A7Q09_10660 [Methylacidiphilum sp. Yel]|uniref:GlxA family transcriptional regulator n=1 Tax=Methylacidiphilum sp. Yel TaxID=1847730 RepID=UPI0011039649|nr:helix-turn-helix domain-containing protein [Methylacidiphilum sp. Yel]TFE65860.1 hypothetical protein A7Q09_10660 [Methylacidiphilum sp. Yel]
MSLEKSFSVAIPVLADSPGVAVISPPFLLEKFSASDFLCADFCADTVKSPFQPIMVSFDGKPVQLGEININCKRSITDFQNPDLIIVPSVGTDFDLSLQINKPYIDWIAKCYRQGSIVASFCTGALILAESGILNGKRATTNWCYAEFFKKKYPNIQWHIDQLIVDEGSVITAGGATSYLNLVIHIGRKFLGQQTALRAAKRMLIDVERHSQLPYMVFSQHKNHGDEALKKAQIIIEKNFQAPPSFQEIAISCGLSTRTLLRKFRATLGLSPSKYLQSVRIEAAKHLLETTNKTIEEISYAVGYEEERSFRRLFKKLTSLSPKAYRAKYGVAVFLNSKDLCSCSGSK